MSEEPSLLVPIDEINPDFSHVSRAGGKRYRAI